MLLLVGSACSPPSDQNAIVRRSADPSGFLGAALPDPYVLPNARLTDTSDRPFDLRTSPSEPVLLMFFSYTHCPDVCIAVLSDVALALSRLDAADRDRIQVVFVTTDPARDKPAKIRKYLDRFDPRFLGLTGDLDTIRRVASKVGVEIEGQRRLPSGGYEIGHGAQVIGFDKTRKGVVLWTQSTPIADLMHDFRLLVAQQQ